MNLEQQLKGNFKFIVFFLLGVVLSFGLPPYSISTLCFLVFPSILYLLKLNNTDPFKNFFIFGTLFGFGYFVCSLYWISYSLNFDPAVAILKPFAIIFLPFALSLFYGAGFYLFRRFFNFGFYFVLNFAIVLSVIEFIRSWLTGFSWNLIVYSLSDQLQSIQLLNLVGTYGLNFLAILFFSFPYLFFNENKRKSTNRMLVFIALLAVNYIYGNERLKNQLQEKDYQIVFVQPNEGLMEIYNYEDDYIKNLIKISDPLSKSDHAIFLWPEGSYSFKGKNNFNQLIQGQFKAKQKIVLGGNTSKEDKIFNSFNTFSSDGKLVGRYNKLHLVPFGEFIPLESLLTKLNLKKVTFGYQSFSRGESRKVLNINGLKVLPLICYEVIDSGALNLNNEMFDVILNISEDGWFNKSIGTHQHYTHSIFRAIEEGKQIIRSTNQGLSASIDPLGKVLSVSSLDKQTVLQSKIYLLKNKTVFSVLGNLMFLFLILLGLLIQLILKRYLKLR